MHINKNYQNLIDYRELATFFMRLASISTQTISDDPAYNKEVADEFHAFQVYEKFVTNTSCENIAYRLYNIEQ